MKPLFTAKGFDRSAILGRAWALFRALVAEGRCEAGDRAAFTVLLREVWDDARRERDEVAAEAAEAAWKADCEAERIAFEMLSPGEKLLRQAADRRMRVEYIDNYEQYRKELKTIEFLEITGASLLAQEEADLEAIEAYAVATRGPVAGPAAAPIRTTAAPVAPRNAWDLTIAATARPVDAGTLVDLRGICGERRAA